MQRKRLKVVAENNMFIRNLYIIGRYDCLGYHEAFLWSNRIFADRY